ncbi:MAG: hypothetical protein PVF15_07885 [Candidatus Bathyarchaeota archaeon]
MIRLVKTLRICFPVLLVICSCLIGITGASSIVTYDEQVVYSYNKILCEFSVKTVVETEEDGTWRLSQAENENWYEINSLITVTYVSPDLFGEKREYPQLRIHFHSLWLRNAALDEHTGDNSSWFTTEFHSSGPLRLTESVRAPSQWGSLFESSSVKLEPSFEYSIYQFNSSLEDIHMLTSVWKGEPIYIDVTQVDEDPLTQISSLRAELSMIKSIVYLLTLTTITLIATTVYFVARKPKVKEPASA